jgi:hypothetical protein
MLEAPRLNAAGKPDHKTDGLKGLAGISGQTLTRAGPRRPRARRRLWRRDRPCFSCFRGPLVRPIAWFLRACCSLRRRDTIGYMTRHCCVDCGKISPITETAYTLIGSKFRWRLSKRTLPDGTSVAEWRCPECWRKSKEAAAKEPG